MFTSLLPDDLDYRIFFTPYAQRYYLKRFAREYPGRRWEVTQDSIFQDLKRIHVLKDGQQVDELKRGAGCILFKYDFAVAQSGMSPKAAGNRCIVFLDTASHRQDVLLVYKKGDVPKNTSETSYVYGLLQEHFEELWEKLD